MKRLFLSLGLSVTILLSAAFAQPMQKKAPASVAPAASVASTKMQQSKHMNSKFAAKFSVNEFKKRAAAPTKVMKPTLKHVATYAAQDPEKAKIKLVVGDCWGDGSGYQILLDKDAHLCDTGFDNGGLNQSIIRTYYDMAEATIPTNASPSANFVLDFESDSAEIEPGVYDVLVVNPSEEEEGVHVYIASGNSVLDDFEFEKGYAYVFELTMDGWYDDCRIIMPFDLSADAVVMPALSCEIGNEVEVKITVTNNGSADVKDFEIWYYTEDVFGEGEDGEDAEEPEPITQTIETTLAAGKTETYTFTTKVENFDSDVLYAVYAGVTPLEKELEEEDNETVGCFIKKNGLTELPYEFDLAAFDFVPANPEAWYIDEDEDGIAYAEADYMTESPLVSRCFDLEAGKMYRLSYEYWAGGSLWGIFDFPEDYHIGFGLTSASIEDWDIVLMQEEVMVEDWEAKDVLLEPTANGTYAVYFSADFQGLMGVRSIKVTEVVDKDARLSAFSTGMARLMPVKQANGAFTASATVQNRGKLTMNATVEVKLGETVVGSANVTNIGADSIISLNIPLTVSGLKAGDKTKIVATVKLDGEEAAELHDNTFEQALEVSDYVMAYDYVTEDMYEEEYGIGASGSIGCGIPFNLVAKDTLTAVSLGWMELDADQTVIIRIYKWNSATKALGNMVYETSVRRGMAAGQRDYKVPSIILEAGEYMISAVQTGSSFYGLICDRKPGVGLYVTTATPVAYQNNLGTPAIRAVFGPDAKPMAKEVFVQEITKPKATGLFAENQEVAATILSQGYEKVTAPVSLMVNGKVVANKQVEVPAYGKAEVTFIADLSAPSTEYVLTVFSALEGDEDLSNDTCTKTVTSLAPADPYVMNFEDCEDFAIEGFNPVWKAVDVDGDFIYGFQGISFPHQDEAFAFIAFNPEVLGLTEDGTMVPHGGDRLGAAFCAVSGQNNDWLISPKLKITAGKEFMTFFVKTYVEDYGLEQYNVLVSTTDDNIESFQQIGETREAPVEDWEEVNIDLKEYSGKEVYLAIQCVSEDHFIFMIDDITVCTSLATEGATRLETQLSVYPNPAREMITIHAQDAVINQVAIFNVAGMMVYQSNALNTTDYRYSVKGLNAGIYFARVTTEQGTAVVKFVIR